MFVINHHSLPHPKVPGGSAQGDKADTAGAPLHLSGPGRWTADPWKCPFQSNDSGSGGAGPQVS